MDIRPQKSTVTSYTWESGSFSQVKDSERLWTAMVRPFGNNHVTGPTILTDNLVPGVFWLSVVSPSIFPKHQATRSICFIFLFCVQILSMQQQLLGTTNVQRFNGQLFSLGIEVEQWDSINKQMIMISYDICIRYVYVSTLYLLHT